MLVRACGRWPSPAGRAWSDLVPPAASIVHSRCRDQWLCNSFEILFQRFPVSVQRSASIFAPLRTGTALPRSARSTWIRLGPFWR